MNNNFFSILISIVNKVLDWLKNVLVRFKKAGFGLFFIKNLFFFQNPIETKRNNLLHSQ